MKLTKTSQWILTVGILAILLVTAGVIYGRQQAEQKGLNLAIAQAQQDFTTYTAQKKDLEARLKELNSRVASTQNEFRHYTQSLEINKTLFDAAEDTNVTITGLRSRIPEEEVVNGVTYQVFSIDMTAEGEVVGLLKFSKEISTRFSTIVVDSVRIDVPEVAGEGSEEKSEINLKLKIYFL